MLTKRYSNFRNGIETSLNDVACDLAEYDNLGELARKNWCKMTLDNEKKATPTTLGKKDLENIDRLRE